jgi:hypothetical protein
MEDYYEVPNSEIDAVASYWFEMLETEELTLSEKSLALSYLALYTAMKEYEEGSYSVTTAVPPSKLLH